MVGILYRFVHFGYSSSVGNNHGKLIIDISRALSEQTAPYPGDEPFSRVLTTSLANGGASNVTSVCGSSHLGTHVDLPFHVSADTEPPPMELFCGPAVVIEVDDWADLKDIDLPPGLRVLFKTANSGKPDDVFDLEFHCISAGAVEWLVAQKAVLVGVDASSVDPVGVLELPNHHALNLAGIAILENLDLSEASPGEYELIALPLKIPGADATWVRAALRK